MPHALADAFLRSLVRISAQIPTHAYATLTWTQGGVELAVKDYHGIPKSAHRALSKAQLDAALTSQIAPPALAWAAQCPLLWAARPETVPQDPGLLITHEYGGIRLRLATAHTTTSFLADHTPTTPAALGMLRHLPQFQGPFSCFDTPYTHPNSTTMAGNALDALLLDRASAAPSSFWIGTYTPRRLPAKAVALGTDLDAFRAAYAARFPTLRARDLTQALAP